MLRKVTKTRPHQLHWGDGSWVLLSHVQSAVTWQLALFKRLVETPRKHRLFTLNLGVVFETYVSSMLQ